MTTVVVEPWRPHPLAWIHRAEARAIAAELRRLGRGARLLVLRDRWLASPPPGPLLLRVSDPVMLEATRALQRRSIQYLGPGAAVLERCYDKHAAYRLASGSGIDCPATALASEADAQPFPLVLKPRRGSDSIGVRLLRDGPLPARVRTDGWLVQELIRGAELTVAMVRGRAGVPLRILLPEGTPYSFTRKYLLRPGRTALADAALAERVRATALEIARVFGVDWAARVDFLHETATGRLRFLECDAAPLVGPRSAFAGSLGAAGVARAEQLRLLLREDA